MQVAESICQLIELDYSCFFCSKATFKTKLAVSYTISAICFVSVLIVLLVYAIELGKVNMMSYYIGETSHDEFLAEGHSMTDFATISLCMLAPVTLAIVYFKVCLSKTLDQCVSYKLRSIKSRMSRLFLFFLSSYVIRVTFETILLTDGFENLMC